MRRDSRGSWAWPPCSTQAPMIGPVPRFQNVQFRTHEIVPATRPDSKAGVLREASAMVGTSGRFLGEHAASEWHRANTLAHRLHYSARVLPAPKSSPLKGTGPLRFRPAGCINDCCLGPINPFAAGLRAPLRCVYFPLAFPCLSDVSENMHPT